MGLSDLKLPNSSLLENAPEHLKLIGLIAVNDAQLDRQLCRLYSLLAGLDSKTFLGRSPMEALTGEVLANIARRASLSQDKVVLLETCVGRVKRCRERLKQMSDSAFGVAQHGLLTAPSSDECGNLMPFAKGELGLLADDIAECAEQFDRFCVYLRSVRPGAQQRRPTGCGSCITFWRLASHSTTTAGASANVSLGVDAQLNDTGLGDNDGKRAI
jgi:hypothetical protein